MHLCKKYHWMCLQLELECVSSWVDSINIDIFFQRGFDSGSLGTLFSHATLGNSLVAVAAGVIAQVVADQFGFV